MNFLENITFRCTRTKSEISILNESQVAHSITLNDTATTIPDMSEDEDEEQKQLHEEILIVVSWN